MNVLEEALGEVVPGRRGKDHPSLAPGDQLCRPWSLQGVFQVDDEELCHKQLSPFSCEVPGCSHRSASLLQSEQHYSARHRFECSACSRHLATPHLLDLHLCEAHDSFFALQAARKPSFACFVEGCAVQSWDAKARMLHCVAEHGYPADYRYDETRRRRPERMEVERPEARRPRAPRAPASVLGSGNRRRGAVSWHQRGKAPPPAPTNIEMKDLEQALPS